MLEWITFITGTAALSYVSRASLRVPKSHGFYRFFAWELILTLIVINMPGWYDAPPSLTQSICTVLMYASLLFGVVGYVSLVRFGQQSPARSDTPMVWFEKTTTLVTHGIYGYIRHPMYSSLILLSWALFFKQISWLSGGIAVTASLFLIAATRVEEAESINFFGSPYQQYMQHTKRFIPFLW